MGLFPSLEKSLESYKLSEDETPTIPVFKSVEYQLSTIVDKISNIENLNDEEIKQIIIRQYSTILDYDLFLASEETRYYAMKIFTNKRFLKFFIEVIGFLNLTRDQIICINKLAYDYYILTEKDSEISDMLFQISYLINNRLVIRLSSILGINGARILSMIANSSFKAEKNVHRINTFIMRCNLALSVQDIVNIYCTLNESFTYPFIYTMLESKPANLTKEQEERFDAISLAILSILYSMTAENIKKVLFDYAFILKMVKTNFTVRFSLKSTKNNRILSIINEIENDPIDTLYIP